MTTVEVCIFHISNILNIIYNMIYNTYVLCNLAMF